ncbi:Hypothetical predicted protein [Podarcis lilfordi]|uniref:Retrotransposon gag domain-containing protein n=1 Tax=Podarcis lilfordi TaxID=74358 RepID=A0AA35PVA9_9SAUR|nr:Hypothetical predicted protein [Podarcis lilfordi]
MLEDNKNVMDGQVLDMGNAAGGAEGGAGESSDPILELRSYTRQLKSQVDVLAGALNEQKLSSENERSLRASKGLGVHPAKYNGDTKHYAAFKTEARYILDIRSAEFSSGKHHIVVLISWLEGLAKDWVIMLMEGQHSALGNLREFWELMDSMFKSPLEHVATEQRLLNLRKGSGSVASYWTAFNLLVQRVGWGQNTGPLAAMYHTGLNSSVLDEMAKMQPMQLLDEIA